MRLNSKYNNINPKKKYDLIFFKLQKKINNKVIKRSARKA